MNTDNLLGSCFCPEGYYGHYTVSAEDSSALLANLFSVSEEDLLRANPHITSAKILQSGTKIHIPGLIPFPAGILFSPTDKELPFANGGGAFIHLSPEGGQSVSVIATLPASSYFGAYDLYMVEVMVTSTNIFEGQLFATPDDPPSWAARIDLPFLTSLTPESRIDIRPFNSLSGEAGEIILALGLADLPLSDCATANTEALSITSEDLPAEENEFNQDSTEITVDEQEVINEETEVFDDIAVISEQPREELSGSEDLSRADYSAEAMDRSITADSDTGDSDLRLDDSLSEDGAASENLLFAEEQPTDMLTTVSLEEAVFRQEENEPAPIVSDSAAEISDDGAEATDIVADIPDTAAEEPPAVEGASAEAAGDSGDLPVETEAALLEPEPLIEETLSSVEDELEEFPQAGSDSAEDKEKLPLTESLAIKAGLATKSIVPDSFQAEQILARLGDGKMLSPRFKPFYYINKNRKPVNLLLTAAAEAEHAIGVASVQLQPSQIIVAAIKLPEPSSLGSQYKYYRAWLVDAGNNKTAVLEMKKIFNGIWIGRSSSTALKAFDLVLVTAETSPDAAKPTGPELLIGILADER